ncbi:hypothetical protein AAF712_006203 [Marasmius tenuissimus]|uniref:Cytochrome P450 n=1 Tax=Marasmius tenuissimus TaxID=585030 RepID=A0ABR3A182_9AGAR
MSPTFLDVGIASGCVALYLVIRYVQYLREPIRSVCCAPREDAHWLWGHEFSVWKEEVSKKYLEWTSILGPVYRIKAPFFQRDVLVAGDNASSSHVLQNAYRYEKAPAFLPITVKLVGRGVVWAHGDVHKHQRRLISPAFTVSAVRGMQDDVSECAEKLVAGIKKTIHARNDESITTNIEPLVASATLDIVGRIAFGHDFCNGESSEAKAISEAWHKDVKMGRTMAGFLAPVVIGAFPFINHLPIPALQKDGVTKTIALKIAADMLKEHRAREKVDGEGRDMLSILVRDQLNRKGEDALEDWELLENISTFIMVGHETTSCSVIFTLLELARHPEVQWKLRQELQELNEFTPDNISNLPYLDAVTKEGLRMHAASPRTDRIALVDDVIPLSKPMTTTSGEKITSIPIKAGQIIQIPTGCINLNPDVWGRDAGQFQPERFITPGGLPAVDQLPHGPYGNSGTFIEGPRTCIGWRLAVMEFKVLLAHLVRDLVFEDTGKRVEEYIAGTLQAFCEGEAAHLPLKISLA